MNHVPTIPEVDIVGVAIHSECAGKPRDRKIIRLILDRLYFRYIDITLSASSACFCASVETKYLELDSLRPMFLDLRSSFEIDSWKLEPSPIKETMTRGGVRSLSVGIVVA